MRRKTAFLALLMSAVACVAASGPTASAAMYRQVNAPNGHSAGKALTSGTIHMKLLGSAASSLLTDGSRWAAYEPALGITRLIDTKTGLDTDRPDPEGCAGGLKAIGGGELLFACTDAECPGQTQSCRFPPHGFSELIPEFESRRYVVADIRGGAEHVVPNTSRVPVGTIETEVRFHLWEVGSQWAGGSWGSEASNPHRASGQGLSVNWHTGLTVYEEKRLPGSGAGVEEESSSRKEEVGNLNRAHLMQRLCAPLTRPFDNEVNANSNYAPFSYQPPLAIIGPTDPGPFDEPAVPLQLRHCGSNRRAGLPTSGIPRFAAAQLGGGVLSWAKNYITRIQPSRYPWHGLIYPLVGMPQKTDLLLQHTATAVFVNGEAEANAAIQHTSKLVAATVEEGAIPQTRERAQVYYARLPWIRVKR